MAVKTSTRSNDAHHQVSTRTFIVGWLCIMLPMGMFAWMKTNQLSITALAILFVPTVAILQGLIGILKYRIFFGDAPVPRTPAHGVVVVNPHPRRDDNNKTTQYGTTENIGCGCLGGRRCRPSLDSEAEQLLQKAYDEPPLRLLVIGDSLAVGVGTAKNCTPLLPEIIARTLSKAMDGRAVFWTCHGQPGATTGWIVKELERGTTAKRTKDVESNVSIYPLELDTMETNSASTCEISLQTTTCSSDEEDEEENEACAFNGWRERLLHHKKRFNPHVLGPYDITVVLTGPNDLKSSFFPFLLADEEAEIRRQIRERGGTFANELRRVLEILADRMKLRLQSSLDHIQKSVEAALPENVLEKMNQLSPRRKSSQPVEEHTTIVEESESRQTSLSFRSPMVVLPGMPAQASPIFRIVPLRWLAIPIFAIMDNNKRALAKSFPDEVLFVEAPTVPAIAEFEAQKGPLWKQRYTEDTLLAIRAISRKACRNIQSQMKDYYREKAGVNEESDPLIVPQHNPPIPPLSELPGPPGSKIFGIDRIHPNDEGYEFWGRHIADAVVQKWKR